VLSPRDYALQAIGKRLRSLQLIEPDDHAAIEWWAIAVTHWPTVKGRRWAELGVRVDASPGRKILAGQFLDDFSVVVENREQ